VGSGLSGRLGNQRVVTSGTTGAWNPANVPEVAAGYFWLPASATGIGTSGFVIPEGNGHTTFDLKQATVASQPTVLTELGGTQYRHRNAANANPTLNIKTAAAVTAGWTGPTYVAMWVRVPDASGDITSAANAFFWHHSTTAPNLRIVTAPVSGTPDVMQPTFSQNGTASGTARCPTWGTADWKWVEFIFDPSLVLGGTTKNDKLKWFFDFVLQTLTTPPTPDFTAINDATAIIGVGCRLSTGNANVDTMDWASCYYANGIPSLPNREALYRHLAPR
jgi:hypothetical protein